MSLKLIVDISDDFSKHFPNNLPKENIMRHTIRICIAVGILLVSSSAISGQRPDKSFFSPKELTLNTNGTVKSGYIAKKITVQEIELLPGMWVEFYDNDMLKMIDYIPNGVKIMKMPCRIIWFRKDGGIKCVMLSKNHKIDKIKFKKGQYVYFGEGNPKASVIPPT